MPLAIDQIIIQRYRILRLLGQGGFGAVYEAWDQNLDRTCALKENLELTAEVSRQFEREARILANLNHPNLPRVTDHFLIENQGQYLVMDYIEGEDLDQRLQRTRRPIPQLEALQWIDMVCDALVYLHSQESPIIHRDIKPANIRITPKNQAMLVDFGIAKVYAPSTHTTIGARAVTPGFSPPEQYSRGETDERSDVYSLGATLYALLTGHTPTDSIDQMSGNAPPLPEAAAINPAINPAVSRTVAQAMAISKQERFQSVRAFRAALSAAVQTGRDLHPHLVSSNSLSNRKERSSGKGGQSDSNGSETVSGLSAGAGMFLTGDMPGSPVMIAVENPAGKSAPRVIHPPRTKPRRRENWLPILLALGVGAVILVFAVVIGVMKVVSDRRAAAEGLATASPVVEGVIATDKPTTAPDTPVPTIYPSPTIDTPAPTITLVPPSPTMPIRPAGAIDIVLPKARLAFVSDHLMDGMERIFTIDVRGGSYWFLPQTGEVVVPDGVDLPVFTAPLGLPADEDHNMAWWPEWCLEDRLILFEAQDNRDPNFQKVYAVSSDPTSSRGITELSWGGFKPGVPRCAHQGGKALVSAVSGSSSQWKLYQFELGENSSPSALELVHEMSAFAGNASWAGDDSWAAFMLRQYTSTPIIFRIGWFLWDNPANFQTVDLLAGAESARYPDISPATGEIVYACLQDGYWGMCAIDRRGLEGRQMLEQLAPEITRRASPKVAVPPVTPVWSADGQWLAYAAVQGGDWDVYLYHPVLDILINLTKDLGGDQFEPRWSKR